MTSIDKTLGFIRVTACDGGLVEELSALATAIVREHYDPIVGREQNDYMLEKFQSVGAIRDQISHGYEYYLVRNQDGDCGFIAFYKRLKALYLSKFYLAKQFRGLGYSHIMLDFLAKKAAEMGVRRIELNVNRFNDAVLVYEKLGFRRIREEKNDIGHGYFMDDYVYALDLI